MNVHTALIGIALSAAALPAGAQDAIAGTTTESAIRDWGRVRAGFGLPNVADVSLSVTVLRPFVIEAGASFLHPGPYGRAGYMWRVKDDRTSAGAGQTVDLSILAGARYLSLLTWYGTVAGAGMNAAATLDGTWWIAPHFGVTAQMTLGGNYWLPTFQHAPTGFDPLVLDLRLAAGLAF